jgi:hypothetical protein
MWIEVHPPAEMAGLTGDEIISMSIEKLKELSKKIRVLEEQLAPLNQEFLFWWKLKKQELLKKTPIQKIPEGVSARDREVSWKLKQVDIESFVSQMTDESRMALLSKLQERSKEL